MKATYHDKDGMKWVYNCGWRIQGRHPYRREIDGVGFISQPIGIKEFHKEFGVYPSEDFDTPWALYQEEVQLSMEAMPPGMKFDCGAKIRMKAPVTFEDVVREAHSEIHATLIKKIRR